MIIFIFFFMIALACYIFRPIAYSNAYCVFLFYLYLVECMFFLKKMKVYGFVNFHFFFLLANLVVTYLYPVYIYPVFPNFILPFDSNYINQGTALSHLAILGYMVGVYQYSVKRVVIYQPYEINRKLPSWAVLLLWCLILVATYFYWNQIGKPYGAIEKNDQLMSLIIVFSVVSLLWNSLYYTCKIYNLRSFVKYNIRIIIPLAIYVGVSLVVGVRFSVLQVMLLLLVAYSLSVRQLKMKYLILIGFVGIILFSFIATTRNFTSDTKYSVDAIEQFMDNNDKEINSIFYNLYDLIGISRNLYIGTEYVEKEGYLYGQSLLPALFSVFPFLPSIMTGLILDKTPKDVTTQYLLSQYSEKDLGEMNFFVGTNCVIDMYMNVGGFLTICSFFFFGMIIQWLLMNCDRCFYVRCCYAILFSSSIFIVRGTIYDDLRGCLWCIILVFLISNIKIKNAV